MHGYWHYPEKFQAVRLLGRRPEDVMQDPEVSRIFLCVSGAHPEPWKLWNEYYQAGMGCDGKPFYLRQVELHSQYIPEQKAAAVAEIQELIDREKSRLKALIDTHFRPIDELDMREAPYRAMVDTSVEGAQVPSIRGRA